MTRGVALLDVGHLITAYADLAEAEGRLLRGHLLRMGLAAGLAVAALLTALGGIGLVLIGLFLILAPTTGHGWAALICGGLLLLCSGVIAWLVKTIS